MKQKMCYLIALVLLVAAPTFIYPIFLMQILCFALFASAFNFLVRYTGLLSFGHASFFGGAGYVAAYSLTALSLPFEASLPLAVLFAGLLGIVMGGLAIRRQGIYFTMITLALAQLMYFLFLEDPRTGGENGLQGVLRGKLFGIVDLGSDLTFYYVVLVVCVVALLAIVRIIHSPFGSVLRAIRENEPRAVSLGYDIGKYKLLAFVLSAMLSGVAGALQATALGFESLTDVQWTTSGLVILVVLVGGMDTLVGPIIGAAIIVAIEHKVGEIGRGLAQLTGLQWFSAMGDSVTIVMGLLFVVCVLAFRGGVAGELAIWIERRASRVNRSTMPEPVK